jgi:hypothetical protein
MYFLERIWGREGRKGGSKREEERYSGRERIRVRGWGEKGREYVRILNIKVIGCFGI